MASTIVVRMPTGSSPIVDRMSHDDPAAHGYAVAYLHYRARLSETPPASHAFGISEAEGMRQRRTVDEAIAAIKAEATQDVAV